jgi:hypothetical protein
MCFAELCVQDNEQGKFGVGGKTLLAYIRKNKHILLLKMATFIT